MVLQGAVALVTGAGHRLGQAIALTLAQAGADIIIHSHTSSAAETQRAVERCGRKAWVIRADLSEGREVKRLVSEAQQRAGSIDILVNNAAAFYPTPLDRLTTVQWHQLLRTNLSAPFLLSLLIGRQMCKRGHGKIIFLGDWSGRRPSRDFLAYCVTKAGIHALVRALAKSLAPQVQVNEVAPGPVLLPENYDRSRQEQLQMATPLQRLGSPYDITRTVRFLAESENFVTGASYVVDGGWLVKGDGSATSL